MDFQKWVDKSEIKLILDATDEKDLENFYSDYMSHFKEDEDISIGTIDYNFLRFFEPIPEEYRIAMDIIRQLRMWDDCWFTEDCRFFRIGTKKIDESIIEPLLDWLEQSPRWGVLQYRSHHIYVTTGEAFNKTRSKWIIEPCDKE